MYIADLNIPNNKIYLYKFWLRLKWHENLEKTLCHYLPETAPFLAEMLEDDDEGTEKNAQNAVWALEDIFKIMFKILDSVI